MRFRKLAAALYLVAAAASAQETRLGADFRNERQDLADSCGKFNFGGIASCAHTLFTDHPLHIAVGSMPPGNGFAGGPAFVYHWTPNESWRLSWNSDAVVSTNASWRVGGYLTAAFKPRRSIGVAAGGAATGSTARSLVRETPVIHAYVQAERLNKLAYFGIGPDTEEVRSFYGMTETIVGGNIAWPIPRLPHFAFFGEVNGRFVSIRSVHGESSPSIEQAHPDAPGLESQPGYVQFGEGVRAAPSLAGGHVRLNYAVTLQQFVAPSATSHSFQRLTLDFQHQFPIYKNVRSGARSGNGPDDCSVDPTVRSLDKCPSPVTQTRNLEGSFGLRLLMVNSFVPTGHIVPFYFQPTLGGSDINGNAMLASYPDYRFRAPNLILARASFEHSIWGPLGITAMIDEGKVANARGDLGFSHLKHTYAAGLTLRAGGFPMVYVMFAWGGRGGSSHTIFNVNTSLLGGGARPSLY